MNKRFFITLATGSLIALLSSDSNAGQAKGKHLVQSQIDKLDDTLAHTNLDYNNRMRIQSYLRRYFSGKPSKLKKPLTGPERDVAKVITDSYDSITRTAGSHHKAAEHYAAQATGLVALYRKHGGMKNKVAASRSAEGVFGKMSDMISGKGRSVKRTEGTTGIGGDLPPAPKKNGVHPTPGRRNGVHPTPGRKASTLKKPRSKPKTAKELAEKKRRKAVKKTQRKIEADKRKKKAEKKARKLRKPRKKPVTE